MKTSLIRMSAIATISLLGAACGSEGDSATPSSASTVDTTIAASTATEPTPAPTTAPSTATSTAPSTAPSTAAVTTTITSPVAAFDLAAIPALIDLTDKGFSDATIAPLSIAQQVIGFPLEIPVPDGSTIVQFSAGLSSAKDTGNTWAFSYGAVAPGGAVPNIDINLADNGPGATQITTIWDPIMTALGFNRANSTASDPGDPGGPNSVNHVYVAAGPSRTVNGVTGELTPVFVWAQEDITGASYTGGTPLGGYQIDVGLNAAADAGIPIPLANALIGTLPLPPGVTLTDLNIDLRTRSADSFDIDKGANYVSIGIEWQAPAKMLDAIVAFYSTPATLFGDESTLMAGEEDFFDKGTIARSELTDYGSGSKRLALLLLQRYEGRLSIDPSADGTVTLSFDVDLNSIAPVLALPAS